MSAEVRLQVALLVLEHFGLSLSEMIESEAADVGVSGVSVLATYRAIGLAATGETDPEVLGIPPTSMAAFVIHETLRSSNG